MADWGNVQQGLVSGYEVGRSTGGGRMGQLGSLIKGVADHLRSERETGEETKRKTGILGIEGLIKGLIEPSQEGGFELPGVGRVRRTPPMEVPEGFEISGYSAKGKPSIKKIKTTQTGQYRDDLRKAKAGEIGWDELVNIYPDKEKTIESIKKFQSAKGFAKKEIPGKRLQTVAPYRLFKRMKPEFGAYNEPTTREINKIKTYDDLIKFHNDSLELEAEGVDVKKISNYYKNEYIKLNKKGLL